MSKVNYKHKKNTYIITRIIVYPEAVNELLLSNINSESYAGLFAVNVKRKHKETMMECIVNGMIPFSKFFNNVISQKTFLEILRKMLFIIQTCYSSNIDIKNLYLKNDVIFINPETNEIKCIYWPIVNNSEYIKIESYLKDLIEDICFNPLENEQYHKKILDFLNNSHPFSINLFEKFIAQLQNGICECQDNMISINSDLNNLNATISANKEYNPFEIMNKNNMSNGTTNNDNNIIKQSQKAYLINDIVPPVFVNNRQFKIGKQCGFNDYVIDNNYISREHSMIIYDDNVYYLIDLGSKNGTFLNNKRIAPNEKIKINNGDIISFVNISFKFCIIK